jgi:hypothetical protein
MASKPPEARREVWNRFYLTALWRNNSADTLVLDFQPLEEPWHKCLLFITFSLGHFVTEVPENSY